MANTKKEEGANITREEIEQGFIEVGWEVRGSYLLARPGSSMRVGSIIPKRVSSPGKWVWKKEE